MSFMKPEVIYGPYFAIETTAGTEIIPGYLTPRSMATVTEYFLEYLEGTPLDLDEVVEPQTGWLGRLSAPGYMDCTAWCAYPSSEAAWADLRETYGLDSYGPEDDEQ